ncbi:hypothetical protein AUEXF2481DRAFT_30476 [Aureobasidium subglaciale EXF-2481]|uniref:Cyclin N-terminal domain-containing protein n=1 Tax=Aureobasidium subglaciale (strain EXF-2481) TaxID=1043005 RepID=A0A074Y9Q9_AURSE|nr:uncharacterized protein AUEXF2481DRAFT_30476 [Aureobasidium subglaciale EXF-2481]KAI5196729.1 hypothetical protein E4T38_08370 [Aureobasidium subglaciale]KAI5214182.1 hypothetical protein E4T40_09167 [Aureobasidium subglaciale]KAI5216705.1 hypothetical protein E4T41_09168 [Aureobasidium subglaciale]KAI5256417.1 hypothetical protein E4T46_08270 [Aureobasidium subglaciale]KEQ94505.1 hypothetical protein AUEXF2481DRAFT_30476 [Aureobasidium subglaciale EXF-2481]
MDFAPTYLCRRSMVSQENIRVHDNLHTPPSSQPSSQTDCKIVPPEQRRNPRRSQANVLLKPPTLVRQEERKATFVDGLVDSAAQMVEVIWPLSVAPCKPQAGGVLSLRRYIEETLRRSRTSYSTLQVALYYLVLIMPSVPKSDFTMQQSVDSPSVRSLQCGRRMFLASLILASKYLQDRNYSAKAWSKMSGLKVAEINLNERAFLAAVNWKLHIPDHLFKRWTDVVLRYTPGQAPPPCGQSFSSEQECWKTIIPQLTPDLEFVAPTAAEAVVSTRAESPVATYASLPSFLEPQTEVRPRTPVLGLSYLPTPRSTPPPAVAPAASVGSAEMCSLGGKFSRRSSFGSQVSSVLSPAASMVFEASRSSPASSVSSTSSYQQDGMVKISSVKSKTSFTAWQSQLTAYDAQPQASRPVKRSQEEMSDSEEYEVRGPLQSTTCSLLQQYEGSKTLPIVLDDEDYTSTSMAAEVASAQAMSQPTCMNAFEEDRKRRRVA